MIKFLRQLLAVLLLSPVFLLSATLATGMLFFTLAAAIATVLMFGLAAFPVYVLYSILLGTKEVKRG